MGREIVLPIFRDMRVILSVSFALATCASLFLEPHLRIFLYSISSLLLRELRNRREDSVSLVLVGF